MIASCIRNSNARKNDPKEKERKLKEWKEKYSKQLKVYQEPLKLKIDNIHPCFLKSIDDSKWKRKELSSLMKERESQAQIEIDRKRTQIAPAYSKGAYQYITNQSDVKSIHKKFQD